MDLHIDIELQGELMLVTARGNLAFDAALRLLKQVPTLRLRIERQTVRVGIILVVLRDALAPKLSRPWLERQALFER